MKEMDHILSQIVPAVSQNTELDGLLVWPPKAFCKLIKSCEGGSDIKTCMIYCNFCSLHSTSKQAWKAQAIKETADTGIGRAQEDKKCFKRPQSQGMWSGKPCQKKEYKI